MEERGEADEGIDDEGDKERKGMTTEPTTMKPKGMEIRAQLFKFQVTNLAINLHVP
jgi:hypothetical protein